MTFKNKEAEKTHICFCSTGKSQTERRVFK
ncbi:MAG: hypothetical protein PWR02_985 [Synergistales bacterium]|nr:hypothetical protein [Synergistales bacterium]MDN5335959.1 hypothetical protein [Synergistales bacterium]